MITYIVKLDIIPGSFFKTLHSCMPFKTSLQTWKNKQKLGKKCDAILKHILWQFQLKPSPQPHHNVFEWRGIKDMLI